MIDVRDGDVVKGFGSTEKVVGHESCRWLRGWHVERIGPCILCFDLLLSGSET